MVAQLTAGNTVAALGLGAALPASFAKAGAATDPCTLLAGSEAQTYVGALSTPPFRACVYRGSGGRQIAIDWNAEGAHRVIVQMSGASGSVGMDLKSADHEKAKALMAAIRSRL